MVGLLSLSNATIIVRHHVTLKIVTVDDVVSRSGGIYTLPAPDHRHGVDGGQAIKHTLHDGSSHPITTKALSCIIRIN
jgi:hypothetical protein